MSSPSQRRYRPDIDGLRAVAVGSVLAFHAFPARFGGGFVGVDVFFVISGYLISGIILAGLEGGTFTFGGFYARRTKRIFPTLLVVFAACLGLGWVVLLGTEYKQLGKHVAGGASFVSNLVLWGEAGYFDASADSKILLHLWSLGIEEQFYLLWPLALFFAAKRPRLTPLLVTALLLASFAFNVVKVRTDPVAAFYSPATRFWELFVGALLAWVTLHEPRSLAWLIAGRGASLRSALGMAMIALALLVVRKRDAFPGTWALLPVLGAALVISAGPDAWLNKHVLSRRAVVVVGLVSYPLYVWHWPLLVFEQLYEDGTYTWQLRLAALALAFVLAWLTTRFLERPFRAGAPAPWKTTLPAVAMAMAFLVGFVVYRRDGFPERFPEVDAYEAFFDNSAPDYRYFRAHDVPRRYRFDCDFYDAETKRGKAAVDPSCYTPRSSKVVALWGDSHAQQYSYGLSVTLPGDVSLLPFATSGCAPSVDPTAPNDRGYCAVANAFAREKLQELAPDVVIVAQASGHASTDFDRIASWLVGVGVKHVVVLGPVPQWRPELHNVIARHYWPDTPARIHTHLVRSIFDTDRAMHARAASRPFTFVSIIDGLCNIDGCLAYLDGDRRDGLLTNDYGHLTARGSVHVATTILAPVVGSML